LIVPLRTSWMRSSSKVSTSSEPLRILNSNHSPRIFGGIGLDTSAPADIKHLPSLFVVASRTILAAKSEKILSLPKTYAINNQFLCSVFSITSVRLKTIAITKAQLTQYNCSSRTKQ
jgi:hypothetical protein